MIGKMTEVCAGHIHQVCYSAMCECPCHKQRDDIFMAKRREAYRAVQKLEHEYRYRQIQRERNREEERENERTRKN